MCVLEFGKYWFHKELAFPAASDSSPSTYSLNGYQTWAEIGPVLKGPAYSVTEAN